MTTPFFSIIIPVYNVEEYVERCITHVLSQTYMDYELILVDDGATDNSGNICDEYANDDFIYVIHQHNGGASSARNAGLDIAKGKYVLFIDADDYWDDPNALELIHGKIVTSGSDIVLFNCKKVYMGSNSIIVNDGGYEFLGKSTHKPQILKDLYTSGRFPGAAWMMCVQRELIESHGLRFPLGVTAEDIIWINHVLIYCNSISAINTPFYVYVNNRQGQVTSKPTIRGCTGMLLAFDDWNNRNAHRAYPGIAMQMAHVYQVLLMHYSRLDKSARESIEMEVRKFSQLLRYGTLMDKYVVRTLVKIFNPCIIGKFIYYCYRQKLQYDI